jgi:predicted phosphodiesterase
MKIALISDAHVEFGERVLPPLPEGVDVLVLAGDIATGDYGEMWARENFEGKVRHIVAINGNHEFYGHVMQDVVRRFRELSKDSDFFHFLENDTVVIDGVTFIGATTWTNYEVGNAGAAPLNMIYARQLNDHNRIGWLEDGVTRLIRPDDCLAMNEVSKDFIFRELKNHPDRTKCVVVTHHGPTERSIHPKYERNELNCCYVNNWGNEIAYNGPAFWLHGHVHDPFDYMVGDTRVIVNPLGYPNERKTPFEWAIIEISSTN